MAGLKRIDFEKPDVIGESGKKYTITSSLNVTRWQEFEKLQNHVGWGLDFSGMMERLKETYELINKLKFADAAVHIHNTMNGIAKSLEKRYHPALLMCTLFIVTDDEDLSKWTESEAMAKIEDWKQYEVGDFFSLAANLVTGYLPAYEAHSQSSLAAAGRKNTGTTKNTA